MAKLVLTVGRSYGRSGTLYRNLTSLYCVVLSSCISCRFLHFASQSLAVQRRLESPKFKSGLYRNSYEVSGLGFFADP